MKPKILIIEDERRLAQLLSMELKHEGYETEIVSDGEEGLEKIQSQEFSAVLLDFMLPKMNGLEICNQTRLFSNIPIIILTARDDIQEEVMKAGANLCLIKPCAIQNILGFLENITSYTKKKHIAS